MQFTAKVISIAPHDKLSEVDARVKYKDVITIVASAVEKPSVSGLLELHVPADLEWEGLEVGQDVIVTIGPPPSGSSDAGTGFSDAGTQPGETSSSPLGPEAQTPASPTGEPAVQGTSEPAAPADPVVAQAQTSPTAGETVVEDE
jgi:hypothetical protein